VGDLSDSAHRHSKGISAKPIWLGNEIVPSALFSALLRVGQARHASKSAD
jgi:hypothetical protein